MKQIIGNKYIKVFKFATFQEVFTFVNNQETIKKLCIDDVYGDNYYCIICYHSLTSEKQFVLSFSSNENIENLNFLYWESLLVLDSAKKIYLIDENLSIKVSINITTPLIGLYLINKDRLLILEEAYMRIINKNGEIIKEELFDLIENFIIKDNLLSLQSHEENREIKLI